MALLYRHWHRHNVCLCSTVYGPAACAPGGNLHPPLGGESCRDQGCQSTMTVWHQSKPYNHQHGPGIQHSGGQMTEQAVKLKSELLDIALCMWITHHTPPALATLLRVRPDKRLNGSSDHSTAGLYNITLMCRRKTGDLYSCTPCTETCTCDRFAQTMFFSNISMKEWMKMQWFKVRLKTDLELA